MILHTCWRRGTSCGFKPSDRYAIVYNSAFMGGVIAIHTPLMAGATCCIYDLRKRGLGHFARWLRKERISVLHMITSIMRRFLQASKDGPGFPHLRQLIPGGERTRSSDIELCKSACGEGSALVPCLGSTECGTIAIMPLPPDYRHKGGPLPLGRPFKALGVHIIRENGTVADPGEEGEIVLRSHYIFRGYLNAEELNHKVLSFTGSGEAVYRTGDFGIMDADGVLYNLGRKDNRVKINGTLVELAEVESTISRTGWVTEVVVVHRKLEPNDSENRLIAFYQPSGESRDDFETRINASLLDSLPHIMIPTIWIPLTAFPQTPTGKTDRKALAAMPLNPI
jgi:acyl-coenzyme A synthetase/AMP-(fatty) acid ligase